jgi:hypothetical protein
VLLRSTRALSPRSSMLSRAEYIMPRVARSPELGVKGVAVTARRTLRSCAGWPRPSDTHNAACWTRVRSLVAEDAWREIPTRNGGVLGPPDRTLPDPKLIRPDHGCRRTDLPLGEKPQKLVSEQGNRNA